MTVPAPCPHRLDLIALARALRADDAGGYTAMMRAVADEGHEFDVLGHALSFIVGLLATLERHWDSAERVEELLDRLLDLHPSECGE